LGAVLVRNAFLQLKAFFHIYDYRLTMFLT
jgi:hypothetical protein